MKIQAENGVYLGELEMKNGTVLFIPRGEQTIYMLQQALKIMKRLE